LALEVRSPSAADKIHPFGRVTNRVEQALMSFRKTSSFSSVDNLSHLLSTIAHSPRQANADVRRPS
jgi:hypothetical protein